MRGEPQSLAASRTATAGHSGKGGVKKESAAKNWHKFMTRHTFFFSLGILGIRECELAFVFSLSLALSLFLPPSRLSLYKQRFFRKLITPNLCVLRSNFLCNVTFIVAAQWQLGVSGESPWSRRRSCHKVRARVRPCGPLCMQMNERRVS